MASDIEQAEKTITDLEAKLARVKARSTEIATERDAISFAVHTDGDHKARAKLDKLNEEGYRQSGEIASIEAALKTAHQRVADRRTAETRKAAAAKAEEARKLAAELGDCFPYLDKHLAEAANALVAIEKGFAQLRALDIGPTDAQVRINVTRCIETWAHRLPRSWHEHLRDGLKFLAPHERRTFSEYGRAIEASLQNAIGQREPPAPQPPKPTKEKRAA
jgi:hypothetical protein